MKLFHNRVVKTILKVAFSVALVGLLLRQIDVGAVASTLSRVELMQYAAAFFLVVLGVFLSTAKWSLILRSLGVRESYPSLLRLYYVGTFFNSMLPGATGGDVVRIGMLRRNRGEARGSISSVLVERVLGVAALWLLAAIGFVTNIHLFQNTITYPLLMVTSTGAGVLLLPLVFPRALSNIAGKGRSLLSHGRLRIVASVCSRIVSFTDSIARNRTRVLWVFGLSLLFQLLSVVVKAFVANSLRLPVDWPYFVALSPVITTLVMLPISVSGIGVREWAYVTLYGTVGLSAADAVAFSFAVFLLVLLNSAVGGLVLVLARSREPSPATAEANRNSKTNVVVKNKVDPA